MRVAIVRREPKVAFSMDVYADNLVAELRKVRPDWDIVEISPQPWCDEDAEDLWQSGNPLRKYYERFYNFPRTVNQLKADIFHIIDHTDGHIAYGLKKAGKSVIVTCHDLVQYIYPEILNNEARFPAFSLAIWRYSVKGITAADRTIAISNNTAQDIINWLKINPEKISMVFNGVNSNFRLPEHKIAVEWRQKHIKSPEEICLLNVGNNHQRKNIETVLKVVKAMVSSNIPVRLWKVGEDFYPEQKQYIQANNLDKHITLINNPDRDTLIRFYHAADILLAPSLYEGFGLTILEAMACGTPIITSNVSALPEVAGDAAILVEPTDVGAITQAIASIHQDSALRQTLVDQGLARVKEFTWKKTAEQTAIVYEQAVAAKSKVMA
jgi:glycosyltransferase involved in cell wall biosynthesis